jgi:diaminopimelate decarboxylase
MKQRVAELGLTIMIEPGRSLVGECGVLLSRVIHRKKNSVKEFVVLDAAMNDLLRPALYQAHHEILPVTQSNRPLMTADIVGPVCETGDFLAKGRTLPELESGELVAVMSAGAYGFVMSSNYNSRPRAAEVLVEDNRWRIVRQREKFEDLVRGE